MLYTDNDRKKQAYRITTVVFAVLFSARGLITIPSLSFASPSGSVDQEEAKVHLDEAIKALQADDTAGAEMHAQLAQDSL